MENLDIPNSAMTASSQLSTAFIPANARLNYKGATGRLGAWIPAVQDHNQWLQVDFGSETQISGISTQGYYNADHWVKSFTLSYSSSGSNFQQYQPEGYTKVQFLSLAVDQFPKIDILVSFTMQSSLSCCCGLMCPGSRTYR